MKRDEGAPATPDRPKTPRPRMGWREWIALPELGIAAIKAKVDTGAATSALHAFDLEFFSRRGVDMVRFKVHPLQRDSGATVVCEAPLLGRRKVRSSSGQAAVRPVIAAQVEVCGERWPVEITLAQRDAMGFRMLLGRQALRRRFFVDPGRSFYGGKPEGADGRGRSGKRGEPKSKGQKRAPRQSG